MGKLYEEGRQRFHIQNYGNRSDTLDGQNLYVQNFEEFEKPRIGLILGTGWSQPDVLKACGFELEMTIKFMNLGLPGKSGAGHPNAFHFGTWHGKAVVISQGRYHLYQDQDLREVSIIRQWISYMLYFMGGSKQLIITSAVGGLHSKLKEDMLVMPIRIVSAHLPMPYLYANDGEFVMSEHLLWMYEPGEHERERQAGEKGECFQYSPHATLFSRRFKFFLEGLGAIGQLPNTASDVRSTHYFIQGPGFGGATERKLWASWGMDTVGMSLDPELRLVALENLSNRPKGVNGAYHETDVRVFPVLFISDSHDLPNNDEIVERAAAMAPKFGTFLSHVVQSEW